MHAQTDNERGDRTLIRLEVLALYIGLEMHSDRPPDVGPSVRK